MFRTGKRTKPNTNEQKNPKEYVVHAHRHFLWLLLCSWSFMTSVGTHTVKENTKGDINKKKIWYKLLEFVKAKEQMVTDYFIRAIFQGIWYNSRVIYNYQIPIVFILSVQDKHLNNFFVVISTIVIEILKKSAFGIFK